MAEAEILAPGTSGEKVDILIVTPLEEERDAILDRLPEYQKADPFKDDIHVYFRAELPVTFSSGSTGTYQIAVMPLLRMGRVEAANATNDGIRCWNPRYVVLVGIAGGVEANGVRLGDILVSDNIADYESQKLTAKGPNIRWKVFSVSSRLLGAAQNFIDKDWLRLIGVERPEPGQPKRHIGPIASGDKVIDYAEALKRYRKTWSKLIGVEMEAGGVALSVLQAEKQARFFMIRGVSDLADGDKSAPEVKRWRPYARNAAAAYTIALLKNGPIPLSPDPHEVNTESYLTPERLQSQTGNYLPVRLETPQVSKSNPFIYGRPVRPDEFVGRERELRTIFNRLRNGESTAVSGQPHAGKTSLLLKLADEKTQQVYLDDDARCLLVVLLDLHHIGNDYTPAVFWTEVLYLLQEHSGQLPISIAHWLDQAAQTGYASHTLRRLFNQLDHEGRRLVLLLDEFEQLLSHSNFQDPTFFALLRSLSTLSGGLALVTASRLSVTEMNERGRGLLDLSSPFFNMMIDMHLKPFDEDTISRLLDQAGDVFSPNDRHFIRRVAGRHPFLLQAMAATLLETGGDDRQAHAAERFYDRIATHFDDLWLTLDDRTRTTAIVLSLLELGQRTLGRGFTCKEIEQVDAFGSRLWKLAKWGLAEQVGKGWQLDRKHLVLWRGKQWTVGTQAFVWWVRNVVVAESRWVPGYSEWLANRGIRSRTQVRAG